LRWKRSLGIKLKWTVGAASSKITYVSGSIHQTTFSSCDRKYGCGVKAALQSKLSDDRRNRGHLDILGAGMYND
jgi:hypothetical protein